MTTTVTRSDFAQLQGITPKLLRFFEDTFGLVATTATQVEGQVAATGSIQSATVLTLSPNDAFQNERVLTQGDGITLTVSDDKVTISASNDITVNGGYRITLNALADTDLDLPFSGAVATTNLGGQTFADNATAAAGGVGSGEMYRRSDGLIAWRST